MEALFLCAIALAVVAGCTVPSDVLDEFATNDRPRLQNGELPRRGPVINAAAFNASAVKRTIAPYSGFVGSQRVAYLGNRGKIEKDLQDLARVVPSGFDPNAMVTIDFKDASLNYILDQLLGGALGVNFVAPKDLPKDIDFRTETPIPKSRVVQVVRDLLARHNLIMALTDGVYQIGSPQVIKALRDNSAAGRSGQQVVRVVKLGKGNAERVAALASRLIPETQNVVIAPTGDSIIVRADPNDVYAIADLLTTLSHTTVGNNKMAIIPLKRSAPEAVATQLSAFYGKTLREQDSSVTILPLTNQQAILVGASDASLMRGVQQLAEQLDRSVTDVSELRVIPVTNLRASDIAPQLAQIFGSSVAPMEPRPTEGGVEKARYLTSLQSRIVNPEPLAPEDDMGNTGLSVPTPPVEAFVSDRTGRNGKSDRLSSQDAGAGGKPFPASTTAAPQAGETRIVADPRTNSILVYSTYSAYKRMRQIVKTLDVPQAQVVIEATVLEVQLNNALRSGVQFFLRSNGIVVGSGVPANNQSPYEGGVIGVGATIGNVSIDAVLKALHSVTNLKVVSSPYLTVVDGQTARLVIGDQIPFASTTQTSNNLGNVTVTQTIKILDTGVVLQITPHIHANNSVDLDITQSVSTPSSQSEANSLTPVISTRDITSKVLAQSGRTILLGGMIQDRLERRESGTPVAADLPLIGGLFKQDEAKAVRTELLVLITPRVVRSSAQIESITRMLQHVQPSGRYRILEAK